MLFKFIKKIKLLRLVLLIFLIGVTVTSIPQLFHKNKGESISLGIYSNGSLKNAYLLPRMGKNFKCYSFLSYYILGREYVNSKVYKTVLDTYSEMEAKHPGRKFIYMETGRRKGGRPYPHGTHQNGLSVDFMSPLKEKDKPVYYNWIGIFRYTLNFDEDGKKKNNSNVEIDFNLMAEHLLILKKNAVQNGLRIKKVIFKTDLKDNLFQTEFGKKLKTSGIYFAQKLTPLLNKLHDDHYHVDFEIVN